MARRRKKKGVKPTKYVGIFGEVLPLLAALNRIDEGTPGSGRISQTIIGGGDPSASISESLQYNTSAKGLVKTATEVAIPAVGGMVLRKFLGRNNPKVKIGNKFGFKAF